MPHDHSEPAPHHAAGDRSAAAMQQPNFTGTLFTVEIVGSTVVITPQVRLSEFDFALIEIEGKQIAEWLAQHTQAPHLIVDLQNSDYFGSSAIGTFVRWWRVVNAGQGRLAMCNLSPQAAELLRITQLDSLWHITAGRDAALRWIAAP
ncbi:MAG: STAS domain-containing protein [Planctomycetota bacterium]